MPITLVRLRARKPIWWPTKGTSTLRRMSQNTSLIGRRPIRHLLCFPTEITFTGTCTLQHKQHTIRTGVNTKSDDRFRTVFEQMYSDPSLFIPWYNVLGNHDVGGGQHKTCINSIFPVHCVVLTWPVGSGFCGASCWSCDTRCDTTENMMKALAAKVPCEFVLRFETLKCK